MVDTQRVAGSRSAGRRGRGGGSGGGGGGGRRGGGRGGEPGRQPPLRLVVGGYRQSGTGEGHEPVGTDDGQLLVGADDGHGGSHGGRSGGTPGGRPVLRLVAEGRKPAGTGGGSGGGGGRGRGRSGRRPDRSGAGTRPPLRLTRRGRIVVVVLAALGMCTAFSAGRVTSSASTPPALPASHMRVHVVTPGETLWEIARKLSPASDTRAVVRWLSERNGLASAELVPGQVLLIP